MLFPATVASRKLILFQMGAETETCTTSYHGQVNVDSETIMLRRTKTRSVIAAKQKKIPGSAGEIAIEGPGNQVAEERNLDAEKPLRALNQRDQTRFSLGLLGFVDDYRQSRSFSAR